MFNNIKKYFNDISNGIKKNMANARVLLELDEKLVNALFAPAMQSEKFYIDSSWQDPTKIYRADTFIDELLPLSEFYQKINPLLSAAIWGIWNTSRYLSRNFVTHFISKKANEKLFVGVRALVATAAVQFSDGTASTVITSDAIRNIVNY